MASKQSPQQQLFREPYRFDFFQAVRLLGWIAREGQAEGPALQPVGKDFGPDQEYVRFRCLPSQAFPSASIVKLRVRDEKTATGHPSPEMLVTFLGLFGPSGALPRHYTQLIIDRLRRKDATLCDFLDLFNHRIISHFYRAWAKYRLPIAYEQAQLESGREDRFTSSLISLVGLDGPGLRRRLELNDGTFLYFAGHFAHRPRNAIGLEMVLSDYFHVKTRIVQLQGQWLYLDEQDQSRPHSSDIRGHYNNRLGRDVVVGARVWSVENRFRVRLGPLNYADFNSFTPGAERLIPLGQLVRMYVGPEFDFDVQLVLCKEEVPATQLAQRSQPAVSRLGWNTWVFNRDFCEDADDAAFVTDGNPTRG